MMRLRIRPLPLILALTTSLVGYAHAAEQPEELGLAHAHILENGLITGGQPDAATLERAKAQGIATVISLRPATEHGQEDEAASAQALGLSFVRIPIAGPADLTTENAQRLAHALASRKPGGVLLHCASGNRVGALLALKAARIDGVASDNALTLGQQAGLTHLEPVVRKLLGLAETSQEPDAKAAR